jgi:toxin ParE1/3/4
MRVVWSVAAVADREEIFDYIAADSPQAAILVDERIQRQIRILAKFPEGGRGGRVEGTRELVIQRTPYLVVYRVTRERVHILRVLHGARRWPEDGSEVE